VCIGLQTQPNRQTAVYQQSAASIGMPHSFLSESSRDSSVRSGENTPQYSLYNSHSPNPTFSHSFFFTFSFSFSLSTYIVGRRKDATGKVSQPRGPSFRSPAASLIFDQNQPNFFKNIVNKLLYKMIYNLPQTNIVLAAGQLLSRTSTKIQVIMTETEQ